MKDDGVPQKTPRVSHLAHLNPDYKLAIEKKQKEASEKTAEFFKKMDDVKKNIVRKAEAAGMSGLFAFSNKVRKVTNLLI